MSYLKTLFIITCIASSALFSALQKINDDLYVAKKGDIYFGFERISTQNLYFWLAYSTAQLQLAEEEGEEAEAEYKKYDEQQEKLKNENKSTNENEIKLEQATKVYKRWINTLAAIHPFQDMIEKFYDRNDVWVAYATPVKIAASAKEMPLNYEGDIKMAVTVATDDRVPFSTHMGIFRAVDDVNFADKTVSSLNLHSFAAQATQAAYNNEKEYMITKPLDIMRKIMLDNLNSNAIWENDKKSTLTQSNDEITLIKRNNKKKIFKTPQFFTHYALEADAPMIVVDIDALTNFTKFED